MFYSAQGVGVVIYKGMLLFAYINKQKLKSLLFTRKVLFDIFIDITEKYRNKSNEIKHKFSPKYFFDGINENILKLLKKNKYILSIEAELSTNNLTNK